MLSRMLKMIHAVDRVSIKHRNFKCYSIDLNDQLSYVTCEFVSLPSASTSALLRTAQSWDEGNGHTQ